MRLRIAKAGCYVIKGDSTRPVPVVPRPGPATIPTPRDKELARALLARLSDGVSGTETERNP